MSWFALKYSIFLIYLFREKLRLARQLIEEKKLHIQKDISAYIYFYIHCCIYVKYVVYYIYDIYIYVLNIENTYMIDFYISISKTIYCSLK